MPTPPSEPVSQLMGADPGPLEPGYQELLTFPLNPDTAPELLSRWSRLAELHGDAYSRLFVATTTNTADAEAEARFKAYMAEVHPQVERWDQQLTRRLLESGVCPQGMALPIQRLRAEAALFRPENQPVEEALGNLRVRYNQVTGARTVQWEGEETTTTQLRSVLQSPDRQLREHAWRLQHARQREDGELLGDLWRQSLTLRRQLASQSDLSDYRAYRWQEMHRFDYRPADNERFLDAIAQVAVPAVDRLLAARKAALGVERLRPWDLDVDPTGRPPLVPFADVDALVEGMATLFEHLDPTLGGYFRQLQAADMLDLDGRKNKAPVGYCLRFPESGLPFIFANALGTHKDLQTLGHEAGHAFHALEVRALPWLFQRTVGAEFTEVASIAMELLTHDVLSDPSLGLYSAEDARQARLQHLESRMLTWPKMATIDGFQHWAYTHPREAADPARCDDAWQALSERFQPWLDWTGLEEDHRLGWQSVPHIHNAPFYYVEYGLAQLGAVQIWVNSRKDRPAALSAYRRALAMGGTANLPRLYKAAGARFSFDVRDLRRAVRALEDEVGALAG